MHESVAVIAAHGDDEVLGCGGFLAKLSNEGARVHILLMSDGESSRASAVADPKVASRIAAREAASEASCKVLGCASVEVLGLADNRMDRVELLDVIKSTEAFLGKHNPTLVLTHHSGDVNVDHRVTHDAVIAACRPQPGHSVLDLLFFEVPSSTEWRPPGSAAPFNPNWFVDISDTLDAKFEALKAYHSEMREFPHARSIIAVEALARWRGATVGVPAAEAYMLGRRIVR